MNKVQKIRTEIERLYNQSLVDENRQAELGLKSAACTSYGKSKVCKELLSFIDSLQEEPTTSVWHDANETPTDKSKVIVWLGEELDEIVQCHYKYGKFVEKIPTEEYGKYILVGNAIEGYSRQFVSNKKRADLTELVVKWAYKDDLIKL